MSLDVTPVIRFGEFDFDRNTVELRKSGQPIPMEPQVFSVLGYLIQHRDRVVPKTELLDGVWGDRFVSESALSSRIKSARRAVGDDGRRQEVIRTAHGRGFRFVAPIDEAGPAESAPITGGDLSTGLIPVAGRPLVGRDDELATLPDRVRRYRLVTVVGPGGVGKTRLATEVARQWEDSGERSVFVALDGITEPELVAAAIAQAVGVRSDAGVDGTSLLTGVLRGESLLIVLDNFEQVLDAASLVAELLEGLPRLRVLITSRERLRLSGEHALELSPLSMSAPGGLSAAVELFEDSAKAVQHDFTVTDENLADVEAICALMDGLPLSIELAAAQLRYLPLAYLRTHLDSNLVSVEDRLEDRPLRHHSVQSTIAWSHAQLTSAQQLLFARLSVFPGEWSLEAVQAVGEFDDIGSTLGALAPLVDKSLVRRTDGSSAPRFAMLNQIREFASAARVEGSYATSAVEAHARYVSSYVANIEDGRWRTGAATWIDDLNTEHGNIVAALSRTVATSDKALSAEIVADLNLWWYRSGRHAEGAKWVGRVLQDVDELPARTAGRLHVTAGLLAVAQRDVKRARWHHEQAVTAADEAGDWRYRQFARCGIASSSIKVADEFDSAIELIDSVVDEVEKRDEPALLAHVLNTRGVLVVWHGDVGLAREHYFRALEINRAVGDRHQQTLNLANLGHLEIEAGAFEEARRYHREGLHLSWRIGSRVMSAWLVAELARVARSVGEVRNAGVLLGASDGELDLLGAHRGPAGDPAAYDDTVSSLRRELGAEEFDALTTEGKTMTFESAVELALTAD